MCKCNSPCGCSFPSNQPGWVKPSVPLKHAALIKAWADGAEIQYNKDGGNWCNTADPAWITSSHFEYRIKPVLKPDLIVNALIDFKNTWKTPSVRISWNGECPAGYQHNPPANVLFIFDGETGELKAAKLNK